MIYSTLLRALSAVQTLTRRELYFRHTLASLKRRGLTIGRNVYVGPWCEFDHGYPFLIEVQDNCRISEGTLILAHDATTFRELGVTRLARVRILEGTFIGARCIILPGCTIGPNAMIAAGSVVNRDIGEGMLAAGNPARPYGSYRELHDKYGRKMAEVPTFDYAAFLHGAISPREIQCALDRSPIAFMRGDGGAREPGAGTQASRRREYEWIG